MREADVAVVGGGIVGLAHALAAAKEGARVVLFDRGERAVGASIRNFGLLWPIGQPAERYERALRSREIWLDLIKRAGLWHAEAGSLHLAHHRDEEEVLAEFLDTTPVARDAGCRLLTPREVAERSEVVVQDGLRGALWSPTEINVDPRQAIPGIAEVLARDFGVELRYRTAVRSISPPKVETTSGDWRVNRVFVCSGDDFQSLYPEVFERSGIRRCKLQMMRTAPQPDGWALGPALCAGLTLLHYAAFAHCESLTALRHRFQDEMPFHLEHGIHVLVSHTATGEITIGDSHHYADTHDPFEREDINRAILDYFSGFAAVPDAQIAERWHGVYPSLPDGRAELVVRPEPGVTVVNGLGGAGMTLSFGLAEEVLRESPARSNSSRKEA